MKHILASGLVLYSAATIADVPAAQKPEVDHLLNFVKHSSCMLTRNGKIHDGDTAVSHINKKYAYFRDDIETTEQFIELSATKSTLSGKYYMVQCGDGQRIKAAEWLLNELEKYRDRQ